MLPASLSLRTRVPLHHISADTGQRSSGLGDLGFGVGRAFDLYDLELRPGLDVLLPTGSRSDGLGHGALAGGPRVDLTRPLGHAFVTAINTSMITNVLEPDSGGDGIAERRAETEMRLGLGGGYDHDGLRAVVDLRLDAPLGGDPDAGSLFVTIAPTLALQVGDNVNLRLFGEFPVRSKRRIDWQTGLSVSVWLNRADRAK